MGSWIYDGFLDSRWVPGFTMDSWIHDGFLDSRWVPGFTMDSWIHNGFLVQGTARHGTEIFGTARIMRARHGNIWHGMDPPDLGTARHGTSLNVVKLGK